MSSSGIGQFIPLILIFIIFYFFLIRPQQKKVKEHKIMVQNLKRGDQVVTSGGIIGTVERVMDNDKAEIMISDKFGQSGSNIIIEEFLDGNEISILTFVDGETMLPMELAKDYKKIGDGDFGLNTGGMGCISPNPNVSENMALTCEKEILKPIMNAIIKENIRSFETTWRGARWTKL